MSDLEKEHLLHKIIAASAFVFALMILPVAQYLLVNNRLPAEKGQVAGVSTDQTITHSNVQSIAECQAQQQKDLADLDRFSQGKKLALQHDFDAAVAPYKAAEQVLQGDPAKIQEEKQALDQLIDGEYQPYAQKVAAVDQAVTTQVQAISSRDCSGQ